MTDRLRLYLHQMQTAASEACRFIDGMDRDEFLKDVLVQRAVGMSILMLGEAVTRLAKEYPDVLINRSDIPWHDIQGLRNRIAHGYFEIDLNIVWETAATSLPDFLCKLDSLHNWRAQGE